MTGFCVPAHLTKEARIRHGLPVSPAPCPKTVFGRVRTGRTREHLPPHGGLSWLQTAQAVPAGSRRARDQCGWLRAVLADPEIAALRADHRRTALELVHVLARHADWHAMTTWRPRARACAEIGSSRDPSRPLSVTAYREAGGGRNDSVGRHAGPEVRFRNAGRPAGEDKPRRVTGCRPGGP